jgi:hypothetical protein
MSKVFVPIESTNVVLLLAGTNNILASYYSDYLPKKGQWISIESPKCSCKTGFKYYQYSVVADPKISIMRYSIDTGHNDMFYQRAFIEVESQSKEDD